MTHGISTIYDSYPSTDPECGMKVPRVSDDSSYLSFFINSVPYVGGKKTFIHFSWIEGFYISQVFRKWLLDTNTQPLTMITIPDSYVFTSETKTVTLLPLFSLFTNVISPLSIYSCHLSLCWTRPPQSLLLYNG